MKSRRILAQNLKARRTELGLSQEELAARAEIDRTYVSALEREKFAASVDVLDQLAAALGVRAADLINPDGSN